MSARPSGVVSGHLPENAWREWPEIFHADVSWPPSELMRLWSQSAVFPHFGANLTLWNVSNLGFPGISRRTHRGNGLKFCMLMYLGHLQNWLIYGYCLLNYCPRPVLAFGYCGCLCRVCPCVCQSVCQSLACPRDYSGPVEARITKFGSKVQNNLVKVPRSLLFCGVIDLAWPSRSNIRSKSKFTPFWACPHHNHHPFKLGSPNLDQRCKKHWLTHCGREDLWKWTIFNTILTSPKSWLSQEDLDADCEHSLVPMDS